MSGLSSVGRAFDCRWLANYPSSYQMVGGSNPPARKVYYYLQIINNNVLRIV
jgi:hypothetical protein